MPDAHVQELGGVDAELFAVLASSCVFVDAVERVTSTEAKAGLHPDHILVEDRVCILVYGFKVPTFKGREESVIIIHQYTARQMNVI